MEARSSPCGWYRNFKPKGKILGISYILHLIFYTFSPFSSHFTPFYTIFQPFFTILHPSNPLNPQKMSTRILELGQYVLLPDFVRFRDKMSLGILSFGAKCLLGKMSTSLVFLFAITKWAWFYWQYISPCDTLITFCEKDVAKRVRAQRFIKARFFHQYVIPANTMNIFPMTQDVKYLSVFEEFRDKL